ncbi:glycosyl hydrolase family protein [Nocardioides guangzhouensis]|uniref:Glycosyl hydrolase family protein n=1 Tax=Nocardioides guangzhouensis TaxID=2497878 RepID=A0A4Q4Z840_9ACTN|nr:glycoside hydrolase family 16 protein [Nocardioides guangzhouensis]RYP83164.1 glycosyl hydrolase family protein [Nocardioides guangzhouensis]
MPSSRRLSAAACALLLPLLATVTIATAGAEPGARAVRQTATLSMHPQLAQPGATPASSAGAKSSMTARFRPVRSGRPVILQRRKGTAWVNVAKARQNSSGVAEFNAPYMVSGRLATYRAYTASWRGLAKKATAAARTDRWGAPDFTDEFTNPATLGTTWKDRSQGYESVGSRKCVKSDPRATSVAGGALRLSVLDDPDRADSGDLANRCDPGEPGGPTYNYRLTGHVTTQGTKFLQYGYVAARVRFQRYAGQHAAVWMQPEPSVASSDPGAEIDVIEWFGDRTNDNTELTSHVYKNGTKYKGPITNTGRFTARNSDWWTRYHVFSVEWTPSRYVFRIDGRKTIEQTRGVSRRPEYLLLSLISSDYELPLQKGSLPQHMYVDWVKYWKR